MTPGLPDRRAARGIDNGVRPEALPSGSNSPKGPRYFAQPQPGPQPSSSLIWMTSKVIF